MNSKNILNKEKLSIFILCSILFLSACGASDEPQPYEENEISIDELEEETYFIEETESAQESEVVDKEAEAWKDYFHVSADKLQGNILGYSLLRFSPYPESNMEYKQDRAYLLDEDMVGKGIYISDYMCETEVFLGNILKDIVISRGAVSGENRAYFTEYALQQLADTNWESLDKEWEPDLYIYDRYYEMNPVSGGGGYRFYYYFFPNQEEIRKGETAEEETSMVDIVLYVDADGKISEIETDISVVPMDDGRIEKWILQNGLFDEDSYGEQIIRNGSPCHEDMVWDFETYFERFMYPDEVYEQENEGLLVSGNVCTSAESVADIFLHVMGNRGADVEKYEEWFKYNFPDFTGADWESLGEDWIMNEEYDCFFIDRISIGWAGFRFYFYPDFQSMGVDTAKAVVIDCNVGISDGLIGYIDIDIFPISEEEYQAVRQKQAESRILVVEKGNVLTGTTEITIPMLDRKVEYMLISEFDTDSAAVEHSGRKVKEEIWGFTDAAEIGDYIGQKFLKDFDEDNADKGEIYELLKDKDERYSVPYSTYYYIEDGWKADSKYDCYYVKSNETEGCMHLQYYFYPEQAYGEQTGKTLVFDVYLSEAGIEDIEASQFWIEYAVTKGYCSMKDLGEMDYYLLCNMDLSKGATGLEAKPSIISNDTQTIEEAKKLYQKFKEQLPLEDDSDEDERTEVIYISPDCKWVKTEKWSEFQTVNTVTLFFQKEKVKEKTGRNTEGLAEIRIIKDGDTYKEVEEQYYKRLSELKKEMRNEK